MISPAGAGSGATHLFKPSGNSRTYRALEAWFSSWPEGRRPQRLIVELGLWGVAPGGGLQGLAQRSSGGSRLGLLDAAFGPLRAQRGFLAAPWSSVASRCSVQGQFPYSTYTQFRDKARLRQPLPWHFMFYSFVVFRLNGFVRSLSFAPPRGTPRRNQQTGRAG